MTIIIRARSLIRTVLVSALIGIPSCFVVGGDSEALNGPVAGLVKIPADEGLAVAYSVQVVVTTLENCDDSLFATETPLPTYPAGAESRAHRRRHSRVSDHIRRWDEWHLRPARNRRALWPGRLCGVAALAIFPTNLQGYTNFLTRKGEVHFLAVWRRFGR